MELNNKNKINVLFSDDINETEALSQKLKEDARKGNDLFYLSKTKLLEKADVLLISCAKNKSETVKYISSVTNNLKMAIILVCNSNKSENIAKSLPDSVSHLYIRSDELKKISLKDKIVEAYNKNETLKKLDFYCNHDLLTGFLNQMSFKQKLDSMITDYQSRQDSFALIVFNVSCYNRIKNKSGYRKSDLLISLVAERLKEIKNQYLYATYLGGDEFAITIDGFFNILSCEKKVKDIKNYLDRDIKLDNLIIKIDCNYGFSVFPSGGESSERLMLNAGTAHREAKKNPSFGSVSYKSKMGQESDESLLIETYLKDALTSNEFELYYQPQIDIKNNIVCGAEALIRWNSKKFGFVSPLNFIPIAEEVGLINEIGEWVLEEVCSKIKIGLHGINKVPISINISAKQFSRINFVENIARVIKKHNVLLSNIVIELTESAVMQDIVKSGQALELLQSMGVMVHIDDFGTGYSSLSHLKLFPLNSLKIDRSFIKGVCDNKDDAAITAAIINLSHNLGLKVIAEGVETKEQLKFLKDNDCDIVQGYYFSKPAPFDNFINWVGDFKNSNN